MFSGPTLFAPLISNATQLAIAKGCDQQKQNYSILLIITDGVINDLELTKAAIISASLAPLSIIIVGVGNADFTEMNLLDSDDKILSANGKSAARDIVQFVS
jgi:copine 5/8/9